VSAGKVDVLMVLGTGRRKMGEMEHVCKDEFEKAGAGVLGLCIRGAV
tara:strand:+ start:12747 stop:12887 length:141 start_codon:yes stop_codon:yes gene_type:complete